MSDRLFALPDPAPEQPRLFLSLNATDTYGTVQRTPGNEQRQWSVGFSHPLVVGNVCFRASSPGALLDLLRPLVEKLEEAAEEWSHCSLCGDEFRFCDMTDNFGGQMLCLGCVDEVRCCATAPYGETKDNPCDSCVSEETLRTNDYAAWAKL